MNDPWDVKSVRQSGFYVSCMKINGTPLLPPVLSQECRKEMQYYKLLAQEVEKRIALLKTFVDDSDSSSSLDKLEELAVQYDQKDKGRSITPNLSTDFDVKVEKVKAIHLDQDIMPSSFMNQPAKSRTNSNGFDNITSNVTIINNTETTHSSAPPKVYIDLSVSINDSNNQALKEPSVQVRTTHEFDFPERDLSPLKHRSVSTSNQESLINNTDKVNLGKVTTSEINNDLDKFTSEVNSEENYFSETIAKQDGPSSLSSKSFTGSLNDIYTESFKGVQSPRLIRQRSYTVLEPSPQLIAHLEVQSLSKGVDVTSISMSESCSNLNSPVKKRRSWDLETAKVKWSSMAMELNQKKIQNVAHSKSKQGKSSTRQAASQNISKNIHIGGKAHNEFQKITSTKLDQNMVTAPIKNDLISVTNNNNSYRHTKEDSPYKISTKTYKLPKRDQQKLPNKESPQDKTLSALSTTPLPKSSDDPATRVRELYEKIQKQQSMQMATLMEKQKREQNLLRQMFEEQNTILYKQLKSICPKQPIEAKEAWVEKSLQEDVDRGPVSLSQLINHKASQSDELDITSSTLTNPSHYVGQSETVSVNTKNISNDSKKSFSKVKPKTVTHTEASQHFTSSASDAMRDHSLQRKSSHSHVTQYSSASEREYEDVILTDRTNDTMADLNFTLTSDDSNPFISNDTCVLNTAASAKDWNVFNINCNANASVLNSPSQNTKNNKRKAVKQLFANPSPKELEAATKIVAYVKGYLVRRLMHTERVQSTVQTIRDALVCALQLHTDQAGIRGADIDLHRRLIQQITAACYNLHETFVLSSPAERCAIISSDRARKLALANRPPRRNSARTPDIMSQSHSCVFPARVRTLSERTMTQSNYENFSDEKHTSMNRARQLTKNADLRRRPWR